VELYNPTSEAVDISGWTLSSTIGRTATVTIPGGTAIEAEGYYIVSRASQWLDNDGEVIILRDANSNEVDRTPALSDDDNDDRSWARYPNGQDTDSVGDWKYQISTIGESNGGEPPPPPPEPTPSPTFSQHQSQLLNQRSALRSSTLMLHPRCTQGSPSPWSSQSPMASLSRRRWARVSPTTWRQWIS